MELFLLSVIASWWRKDTYKLAEYERPCAVSQGDIKAYAGSLGIGSTDRGEQG